MPEINYESARRTMIASQLRTSDVLEERLLEAVARLPREDFVPAEYRNIAYVDVQIPIAEGAALLQPRLEGRMAQALEIQPRDTVLEVGTGSGYFAALLGLLAHAGRVTSVEIDAALAVAARARIARAGLTNVTVVEGDANRGVAMDLRYDAIAITASLPQLPEHFRQALNIGGRLVAVLGEAPAMEMVCIRRIGPAQFERRSLFETELPALRNAPRGSRFTF